MVSKGMAVFTMYLVDVMLQLDGMMTHNRSFGYLVAEIQVQVQILRVS